MNGRAARETRKAATEAAMMTAADFRGTFESQMALMAQTLSRVEGLERGMGRLEIGARSQAAFRGRNFLWRLRWIFTGR